MREVPRDEKWHEGTDARMAEVQQNMNDSMDHLEAMENSTGPSEAELVQIALLMRLYDLNMALLSVMSKVTADEVYEAHARGEHFNPPVFLPDMRPAETPSE